MDNDPNKKSPGLPDRAILAVVGIVAIFLLAIMVFFLVRYPIPLSGSASPTNPDNNLFMIITGFAGIACGIGWFLGTRKQRNLDGDPGNNCAQLPSGEKIRMAAAAIVIAAATVYAIAFGILPWLFADLG